jgi:hypothetical protein
MLLFADMAVQKNSVLGRLLDPMVETSKRKWGEVLFILILIAVTVIYWYQTLSMRPESAQVPRLVIITNFFVLVIAVFFLYFGEPIKEKLNLKKETDLLNSIDTAVEDQDSFTSYKGFDLLRAIKELAWSVGYVLGVLYIGFFTTNFVFAATYIYMKTPAETTEEKIKEALIWGATFVVAAYVIFIYILGNNIIWHLGYLW